MTNYEIIVDAIINKKQVIGTYNGYHREMCPHVIGQRMAGGKRCFISSLAIPAVG